MYSFTSRVRFSEVDCDQQMTLHAILNYFQDCSIFHSAHVHLSIDELTEMGCAWVLTSWQVIVERYPKLGEEILISTWPYGFKGFYGYRNFTIRDSDGTVCAYANTIWTFLDMKTMHPMKVQEWLGDAYGLDEQYPMECAPRKVKVPKEKLVKAAPVPVVSSHTDVYRHMNNAVYVQLAQELLPEGTAFRQMRAEYRTAAVAGDVMYPYIAEDDGKYIINFRNENGGTFAAVEFTIKASALRVH